MAAVAILACCGCVIRTEGAEHYVGPVLIRATDACHGRAVAVQSLHLGLSGEVGRQMGVAVGVAERVAAAPVVDGSSAAQCDEWTVVGIPGTIDPDRWTFSPFYAKRRTASPSELVWRQLFGAQVAAGSELSAMSVGVVSRTELAPGPDAYYRLTFDTTKPMQARFQKWPYRPGEVLPELTTEEEEP
jgi:hypothetical protein